MKYCECNAWDRFHNTSISSYKLYNKLAIFIGKPFQPGVLEHSSLLGWFVGYVENEVLWIETLEPY